MSLNTIIRRNRKPAIPGDDVLNEMKADQLRALCEALGVDYGANKGEATANLAEKRGS